MSDKQDDNNTPPDSEAPAEIEQELAALAAGKEEVAAVERPAPRPGVSKLALLALLLVIGLAGAAAWSFLELQRREGALVDRLEMLEGIAADKQDNLDGLVADWEQKLESGLARLGRESEGLSRQLKAEDERQAQNLERFEASLSQQRAELARFSATDRDSWLLAEAEYLLRLANQRLVMAGDTVAAAALLDSADAILLEMDDAAMHQARAALAADLAALKAVPRLDTEGTYLRLGALIEQADRLVIFQLPEQEQQLDTAPADSWQGRLQQGYEEALGKLSDYIIIRRRDVPMQALMDPQWEGLVRQNLRMLLEQAQVALLSANQVLYSESLERARHWVAEFFEADEAAARALDRDIAELMQRDVAVDMPDLSRSLRALDAAVAERLSQGGNDA